MIKVFTIGVLLPFAALGLLTFAFGSAGTVALAPQGLIALAVMIRRRPGH